MGDGADDEEDEVSQLVEDFAKSIRSSLRSNRKGFAVSVDASSLRSAEDAESLFVVNTGSRENNQEGTNQTHSNDWVEEDFDDEDPQSSTTLVESPSKFIAMDESIAFVAGQLGFSGWSNPFYLSPSRTGDLPSAAQRSGADFSGLPLRGDEQSFSEAELSFIEKSKSRARGVERSPPPGRASSFTRSSPMSVTNSDNTSTRSLFSRSTDPSPDQRQGRYPSSRSDGTYRQTSPLRDSSPNRSLRTRSLSPTRSVRSSLRPLAGSPSQSIPTSYAPLSAPTSSRHSPVESVTPTPRFDASQEEEIDAAEFRVHSMATPPPPAKSAVDAAPKDRNSPAPPPPRSLSKQNKSAPDLRNRANPAVLPRKASLAEMQNMQNGYNLASFSSVPDNNGMAESLSEALDDIDRLRREIGRLRNDVGSRDAEIARLRNEVRRAEEWVRQINDEAIRRIKQVEVRMQDSVEALKDQLYDAVERARVLEAEASKRAENLDGSDRAQVMEFRQLEELLEQLNAERQELGDLLKQEKAKNGRTEDEFRLFGRRLRSLQDSNRELRAENESLRAELRKYQYEGSSNSASASDTFYKGKLEQALYDIESLKALATSVNDQNANLRAELESRGLRQALSPTGIPRTATQAYPLNLRSPPGASPARRKAWDISPTNESDRFSFSERMRRLEDREGSMTPTRRGSQSWHSSGGDRSELTNSPSSSSAAAIRGGPMTATRNVSSGVSAALAGSLLDGVDYVALRDSLEEQLRTLTAEKSALTAELQRVPKSGSGVRRRKDEIDDRLDEVERDIGSLRQRMRSLHML